MQRPLVTFLGFLLCLAFQVPAFSQVSSGSLLGDARDDKTASVEAVLIVAQQ